MSGCFCGAVLEDGQCVAASGHVQPTHDPLDPANVQTLYLAGPMSGYSECNYPEFNRVAAILREAGYTVANPAENTLQGSYEDFLRLDLRQMLDCQAIAVLHGWTGSTGARNEVRVANLLKMPVMDWQGWVAAREGERETSRATDLGMDLPWIRYS